MFQCPDFSEITSSDRAIAEHELNNSLSKFFSSLSDKSLRMLVCSVEESMYEDAADRCEYFERLIRIQNMNREYPQIVTTLPKWRMEIEHEIESLSNEIPRATKLTNQLLNNNHQLISQTSSITSLLSEIESLHEQIVLTSSLYFMDSENNSSLELILINLYYNENNLTKCAQDIFEIKKKLRYLDNFKQKMNCPLAQQENEPPVLQKKR